MRKLILLKVLFNASTRLWSVYLTMEVYLLLAHDDPWFLSPSNSININFPLTDYCIWFPWQQLPTWHSFIYMETVIEAKLLHNQRWIDELHFFRAESYRLGGLILCLPRPWRGSLKSLIARFMWYRLPHSCFGLFEVQRFSYTLESNSTVEGLCIVTAMMGIRYVTTWHDMATHVLAPRTERE